MKSLACRDMGIDCDHVTTGETDEATMSAAKEHVQSMHADKMNEMMQTMTEEQMTEMMKSKMKDMM